MLFRSGELEEILLTVQRQSLIPKTMSANGTITVETEQESYSGSFELSYDNRDSLLIRLFGPFGISVCALQITRDSFYLYNAFDSRVVIASLQDKAMETLLHFSGDFETIWKIFSSEHILFHKGDSLSVNDEGEIVLTTTNIQSPKKFWLNISSETLERCSEYSDEKRERLSKVMKRYTSIGEKKFPFWIRSSFPQQNRIITVSYDNIEFDKVVSCFLSIPKNTEVIHR